MSEQLWKYVPHIPQTSKKHSSSKKKTELVDKEVLNLTGGLFPMQITQVDNQANSNIKNNRNGQHFVYVPIIQSNSNIGPIYHWVKEQEEKKLYHGEKFNVDPDIPKFTQEEFKQLNLPTWEYSTVREIFDLMEQFNMNFIVVHDRLVDTSLTVEDIKEIYFTVCRMYYQKRDQKEKVLYSYVFDKEYEVNRKYELEKYMMRNKVDTDRQKYLINEIKRLEILIKKEEREQINLKKVLRLDEVPEENFNLDNEESASINKSRKVWTRQQYLMSPLKLPGKVSQRLTEVLAGMNIPEKIIATEENTEIYDKLRQKVLLMFSMQRYIKKKNIEKANLEDKKRKLLIQEEDEKKNIIKSSDPKKKIHQNVKS